MRSAQYIVAGLNDADMIWLLSQGHLRSVRPRERLVEAGKPVMHLFFVIRGRLAVVTAAGATVTTLYESDVIGEMSFIEQRAPSVSVVGSAEKAEVLEIPRDTILKRFEQEPVFAARFYRALAVYLSARLRETTQAAIAEPVVQTSAQTEARFGKLWQKFAG
jgi:CRP/FNR family cyclic AMP-dependent transcriptional regulator